MVHDRFWDVNSCTQRFCYPMDHAVGDAEILVDIGESVAIWFVLPLGA
jgi:hypothetical protein